MQSCCIRVRLHLELPLSDPELPLARLQMATFVVEQQVDAQPIEPQSCSIRLDSPAAVVAHCSNRASVSIAFAALAIMSTKSSFVIMAFLCRLHSSSELTDLGAAPDRCPAWL